MRIPRQDEVKVALRKKYGRKVGIYGVQLGRLGRIDGYFGICAKHMCRRLHGNMTFHMFAYFAEGRLVLLPIPAEQTVPGLSDLERLALVAT